MVREEAWEDRACKTLMMRQESVSCKVIGRRGLYKKALAVLETIGEPTVMNDVCCCWWRCSDTLLMEENPSRCLKGHTARMTESYFY